MIRLVLSCGMERRIDRIVWDAYDVKDGDAGWCPEHPDSTVDAMFAEEGDAVTHVTGHER